MAGCPSRSWLVFILHFCLLPEIFNSSYILFFLVQLIQAGMCLGEILTDAASQQDDLASAQARARDFKGQTAQLKKELEKSQTEDQDQRRPRRNWRLLHSGWLGWKRSLELRMLTASG